MNVQQVAVSDVEMKTSSLGVDQPRPVLVVNPGTEAVSVKEHSGYVNHTAGTGAGECFCPSPGHSSSYSNCSSSSSSSASAAVTSPVKTASSVDERDSAYMTLPASSTSTPSSLSPVSWAQVWRDNVDVDDDDVDGESVDVVRQSSGGGGVRVQRRSWAGTPAGRRHSQGLYQPQQLHQSESCHDVTQRDTTTSPTTTTRPVDDEHKFAVPTGMPVMLSLSASARRRLGKRRDVSVTSSTSNNNNNASAAAATTTGSSSSSGVFELHRAPSSLFYLQYNDDDDDDDDDDVYDDGDIGGDDAIRRRKMRRYLDLPSSRKISAAGYLAHLNSPTTPPPSPFIDDNRQSQPQQPQPRDNERDGNANDVRQATVAKRRRRQPPQQLAVTTVDEILRRQESSLQEYYEDTLKQIDAVTKVFRLNDDMYRQLMSVLNAQMDRGLQKNGHHEATVKMFHTYVRDLPTGSESGRYVALDLGGTNFRVLLVELKGRRQERPNVVSKVFLIPSRIMLGSGEMLFDHIVNCIAEFLDELGLKHQHFSLGFTFSFPCRQQGLASATLVRWTKGFKCSGVENEDVVALLHEAIARRQDLSVQCVAVINDNVGVLMTGAHSDPNCRIGLILGTGTNCCYLEDLEKVELWTGDRDEPRQMVVNTEWGAFGDHGEIEFVRNEFDRLVDQQSLNPQHQLFEKMISGMYMGELVRLVLCELTTRGLLFNGQLSEELIEPQRFYTKYISEIESDDAAGDYANTRLVLQELSINDVTLDDCRYVQHVCWQVSQRAAHLAAAAVSVVIERVGLNDVTVAVDGSLYRFHPHFKQLMYNKISQLLPSNLQFKLTLAHDGSGQGAALVAATAGPPTDSSE